MDAFKSLLWDSLIKAAIARLFVLVPWLGYGPLGAIVSMLIFKFTDIVYAGLKLSFDLEKIVLIDSELKNAYNDSCVRLHIAAKDKGVLSSEFKELRNEHQQKLSSLIHFNI